MIEIYLDGTALEVPQDISIGLNLGIADYSDPVTASGSYTQTIDIPRTPHNDRAFAFAAEVLSAEHFNNAEHTARIVQDGSELIDGKAYLDEATQYFYRLQIVGAEIDWVMKLRDKKMSELEGEPIGRYHPDDWAELSAMGADRFPKLSFVLMQHGHWYQDINGEKYPRRWATYSDLIPMVQLRSVLEHCFSGFDIVTSDAIKRLLQKTYVTTQWRTNEEASELEEDYSFEVTNKLLNADENGEVVASITDEERVVSLRAFDTIEEDKNGRIVGEDGENLNFRTTRDMPISLEIETRYQTDAVFHDEEYQDKDGGFDQVATSELAFADQLYNIGDDIAPILQLSVEDSVEFNTKSEVLYGDYVKLVDNYPGDDDWNFNTSPANMPLLYIEVEDPSLYESIGYYVSTIYSLNENDESKSYGFYRPTQSFVGTKNTIRSNYSYARGSRGKNIAYYLQIWPALRGKDGNIYWPRELYRGGPNVTHQLEPEQMRCWKLSTWQKLTFDIALKTPTVELRKLTGIGATRLLPISFIRLGASNIPNDAEIKVYATSGGSLKPSFAWGVAQGDPVKMLDVGGDTLAEDMLRAIMQLYNLLILTNPKTKEVNIYSFAEFWNDNIVDWGNRIDLDSDISVSAIGDSIGETVMLRYADDSPRIEYYDARHELPYFAYKYNLPSKVATDDKEVQNALFSPAYMVRVSDEFEGGDGNVPAVAKKDAEGTTLEFNVADVPHTVVLVAEGGESVAPSKLPIDTTVFGDIGGIQPPMTDTIKEMATLSFANREGVNGLHQYYDKQVELWKKGKRLVCNCRVEPWEVESLRYNTDNINFRSLFYLNIKGEDVYARLEGIEYEPSNATNKCTFIIE